MHRELLTFTPGTLRVHSLEMARAIAFVFSRTSSVAAYG